MNISLMYDLADYVETIPLKHWDMWQWGEPGLETFACGTKGCLAGHIAAHHYTDFRRYVEMTDDLLDEESLYLHARGFVIDLLKLSPSQEFELFSAGSWMLPVHKAQKMREMADHCAAQKGVV